MTAALDLDELERRARAMVETQQALEDAIGDADRFSVAIKACSKASYEYNRAVNERVVLALCVALRESRPSVAPDGVCGPVAGTGQAETGETT